MIAILSSSCGLIRKTKNASTIRFADKNVGLIEECAKVAIAISLEQNLNSFSVKDLSYRKDRRRIESLGSEVRIVFEGGGNDEIKDSTVTFRTVTVLMGVTEIVYDFAFTPRTFENRGRRTGDYYFVKVRDRIYYRKRPFPMM